MNDVLLIIFWCILMVALMVTPFILAILASDDLKTGILE